MNRSKEAIDTVYTGTLCVDGLKITYLNLVQASIRQFKIYHVAVLSNDVFCVI